MTRDFGDFQTPAALVAALLNHETTLRFMRSTMFVDSKKPVTRKLLQRIDVSKLLTRITRAEIVEAVGN